MEDYKEKYEKVLAHARRAHGSGVYHDATLEAIFPELKDCACKPNGCIVREDFEQGDGYYKVNLGYLDKKQVDEVEKLVKSWNPKNCTEEIIRRCIGIILTDASEERFSDYGVTLKDCLEWLTDQRKKDNLIKELGEYKTKYTQEVLGKLA